MNVKQFKKLIREAIREEIMDIFSSSPKNKLNENFTEFDFSSRGVNVNSDSNDDLKLEIKQKLAQNMLSAFGAPTPKPQPNLTPNNTDNPFSSFLSDTANNMSAQDIANFRNIS